ncbi:uncharacterized protein BDR25DRAFT_274753 [Lindgomyces ingoldianus]|uniref:Uncharacterized protein n=1 Tax=Lindgomyces ingoldianus TaxID=673940 RepID=A0ACB6REJ7_9PLEO|nr:uncharacterized protein BDR25DRAFT_274753 [Lindgomyces ingoldianus]KAF2477542.1 hypothetical protein BDR25DRAFT_274753 [Lindgomyces ingoldianus]
MANFDSNQWYQLYVNQNKDSSLLGTNLYKNGESGAVFFNTTDTDLPGQRWQIYSVNDTYVLRNKDGGTNAFLGTKYEPTETTPGQTQALMIKNTISDDAVYWTVTPWGDGTFYLTNGENGTSWHLKKKANGLLALDSNITAPQNGQRFSFKTIGAINDKKFSSVNVRHDTPFI